MTTSLQEGRERERESGKVVEGRFREYFWMDNIGKLPSVRDVSLFFF